MANSPTLAMTNDWNKKESLKAHNSLEEFRKPDTLNALILTKVYLVVEKLSGQCDATAVRVDIATLMELIQIRKLRNSELDRLQARLWR
jgi:hypothetical protein